MQIFGIGFTAPWLLLALAALPLLWLLLRAVPPAPVRRRFPGVALLLGLADAEQQSDKTPWWLLLLRMLALAAVIIGFAGPVLNPVDEGEGTGPLLVLFDGSWADARDWDGRVARAEAALDEAAVSGRLAAVVSLTDLPPGPPVFRAADAAARDLPGLAPRAWTATAPAVTDWADTLDGDFETLWLSDGVAQEWRAPVLADLQDRGPVTVFESPRPVYLLHPATFTDGAVRMDVLRARTDGPAEVAVTAHGLDPNGVERELGRGIARFADGAGTAPVALELPPELRNRVTRFEVAGVRSAGAVSLTDDSLKRREIALLGSGGNREGLRLLAPTHYLEQALSPSADLIDGPIEEVLLANPDVIIMADIATVTAAEETALLDWIDGGGVLLRFAGPRLAASEVSRAEEDPLLPVRLRSGGRSVGGAMSWGEPKALRTFAEGSPFAGLAVPDDVRVSAQVMAQPDPGLADRTIASLTDGTPLVTRKRMGQGQVVLFHVTATAEWSTLPISGLFVEMLERLAISSATERPEPGDLEGTTWVPDAVLDARGRVVDPGNLPGLPGEVLASARPGPDTPPGLYAGDDRWVALNVGDGQTTLVPTAWPDDVTVEGLELGDETPLQGPMLTAALILLALDLLASLWIGGRLGGLRRRAGGAAVIAVALLLALPGPGARAQGTTDPAGGAGAATGGPAGAGADTSPTTAPDAAADARAVEATSEVVLAHVLTGDAQVDAVAQAGLRGLSRVLYERTSIEPAAPMGVDVETDELAFYPFLYWPVTADQPIPSDAAYARLNTYLRTGGMILFDTRDADVAGFGSGTPAGDRLQELAAPLDIPPLEPIPQDHVLTRAFYLLQDFPGRYAGRDIWVEAAPADARQVEGMPFRNLNDNVTPVVIGGNDWAAAWARDEGGTWMFPVGRGFAGERQREIAYRFGVNLMMHVFTGNYKSDQVHVPALLDRLGQ
ncbi:DUF4159 domain-containing protein [Mesobaculum littorinae]|uniref:DUF4159 domain-containing protein n=1 Tax=Mesobaculum littorinae TaxID=2486419 RepID=A0A438AEV0_9RHOB|nr:DUF4159 domain-containing protein [Mesobaculum littorinae]RVV97145.1 DUF4159 domain-containing protein [Mesobaculum littorinae]